MNVEATPVTVTAWGRFPACLGRFDDPDSRATIDELVQWVEERYREDLERRPSKHAYVRTLPAWATERIDRLRDSALLRDEILSAFPVGAVITPMKHTDELYISHYNRDRGGDQGLFSKHYDGNLRGVPFGSVVRALIYLQSGTSYQVVFHDSGVRKAFTTYEFGLLDFHRELHWVEGAYDPNDIQRILLKCNFLVTPPGAHAAAWTLLAANTAVFYVVKAAMEYSKSPSNLAQRTVGLLCNLFRALNNVHPLVPAAFILVVLGAAGYAVSRLMALAG
jgi:hypothetical protein